MIKAITTSDFILRGRDFTKPVFADIETEDLYVNCSLIQLRQSNETYIIKTNTDLEVSEMVEFMRPMHLVWWGGNYDMGTLKFVPEIVDDLWIAFKIAYPKIPGQNFDLLSACRHLGYSDLYVDIDKKGMQKEGFVRKAYLSQDQLRYASDDVEALDRMWNDERIQSVVQNNLAYKLAIYALRESIIWSQNGLPILRDKVKEYMEKTVVNIDKYMAELEALVGRPLNPRSSKQVKEYLGTPTSDKAILTRIALEGELDEAKAYAAKVRVKARNAQSFTPEQQKAAEIILLARKAKNDLSKLNQYDYEILYGFFSPVGARTSRWTCFPGDTMITTVGYRKRIDEIVPGDIVYTFSDEGNLELNKVKRLMTQGKHRTIKLHYQSQGNRQRSVLECTPEHKIRLFDGTWCEAQHTKGKRVSYVQRNTLKDSRDKLRWYVNSNGCKKDMPEHYLLKDYHGLEQARHVHHLGSDTLDNSSNNIEFLTCADHSAKHIGSIKASPSYGEDNPAYYGRSKYSYIKELMKNKARSLKSKNKMLRDYPELRGFIDLLKLRFNYSNEWLSMNRIRAAHHSCNSYTDLNRVLNYTSEAMITRPKRIKRLLNLLDLNNHNITHITEGSVQDVYDLEIENNHNFIANEICVHNCKGSKAIGNTNNLQNYSRDFKSCFGIKEGSGKIIVAADFATLEIRIAAAIMKEPNMYKALMAGADIHKATASLIYDKPLDEIHGRERSNAKVANFGLTYGMGMETFRHYAYDMYGIKFTSAEVKTLVGKFFKAYPGLKTYHNMVGGRLRKRNYVCQTALGYKMKPQAYAEAINGPTQGTGGEVMRLAIHMLIKSDKTALKYIVNSIHDAAYLIVPEIEKDYWGDLLKTSMQEAWYEIRKSKVFHYHDIPMPVDLMFGYSMGDLEEDFAGGGQALSVEEVRASRKRNMQ